MKAIGSVTAYLWILVQNWLVSGAGRLVDLDPGVNAKRV